VKRITSKDIFFRYMCGVLLSCSGYYDIINDVKSVKYNN